MAYIFASYDTCARQSNDSLSTVTISSSQYTTTSSSTVPGPGALSGKAILALGKATLRGLRVLEAILVRQRLSTIASKFPHEDVTNISDIQQIYADLLEVSRVDLYPQRERYRALQLLFGQIARNETKHLVIALSKWPLIELHLFLSHIMHLIPWLWTSIELSVQDQILMESYRASRPSWPFHPANPFIQFIEQLVRAKDRACLAICDAGFLHTLMGMYVDDFHDPYQVFTGPEYSLFSTCCSSLVALSMSTAGMQQIAAHPICRLWPKRPDLCFPHNPSERFDAWIAMGREFVERRIHVISTTFAKGEPAFDQIFDAVVDILEFSGSDAFGGEIAALALSTLSSLDNSILLYAATADYLRNCDYNHFVSTIYRIIEQGRKTSDTEVPRSVTISQIHYLLSTVEYGDETYRQAIFDAGILKILLPILRQELLSDSDFLNTFIKMEDICSSAENGSMLDTWKLVESVRVRGYAAYFSTGKRSHILQVAFRVLFQSSSEVYDDVAKIIHNY